MRCFNCEAELDPTLLYCRECGVPVDATAEDVQRDAEEQAAERMRREAVQQARGYLVLALFLFAAVVAARAVLLSEQHYEHFPAYRVPASIVEERGLDAPVALDLEMQPLPLPGE
ncbi:MAG: hypothetical protein D6731_17975 [Planctomycetota bacterium]|nr:MAG: hypothetical protein D6731_17975 [Planctomycetota bacterium]